MRRTPKKKLALPLSLLALGALGLVACGGDDDEDTTAEAQVSAGSTAETRFPAETTTEAKVSPDISLVPAKPSPELVRALRQDANTWASRFATKACNRYMGQPLCVRLDCSQLENCKSGLAAFQQSFADATVEDIKYKGIEQVGGPLGSIYVAAVTYSNGVVVVFGGGRPEVELPAGSCPGSSGDCTWALANVESNRRFIQASSKPPRH
jgi:hypothetical protein